MYVKHIAWLTIFVGTVFGIYPYFDTQDFIYNVPKVYRISITLDKLLEYYEKKPSKDPEWYIALGIARVLPDGATLIPWKLGRPLVWDVTCVDTLAPFHLPRTSVAAGSAAEFAENRKRLKYSNIDEGYLFEPFGVETLGPWGPSAHRLFRELSRRLVDTSGDQRAGTYLAQRISIAIQRGNAVSLLGIVPRDTEVFVSQLEYTINELDKSVPPKLKENLQNLTRRMDRIRNSTDYSDLVYRSKDYEYVAKAMFQNMDVMSTLMEPITLGTMGTQKPYRFNFEQYVQEARNKMPTRKAADACTMQLLISVMESQTTQSDGSCELTPECSEQIIKGSGLAFQQTSRVRAAALAHLFDCMEGLDISSHIYKLCIMIYKESKSLEAWDHPPGTKTLFMQQILYCASQGYGEFIKPRWMNKIIAWQEPKGCYSDDRQPFMKLTGYIGASMTATQKDREEEYRLKKAATSEGGACNSLASAMALGSLVVYVRALLETDQAFQYDVLT